MRLLLRNLGRWLLNWICRSHAEGSAVVTGLDALDLSNNRISGEGRPPVDGGCWRGANPAAGPLRKQDLRRLSNFTNCSRVGYLNLSGNLIVGEVVGDYCYCYAMRMLNLSGNHLIGASDVAGLTSLTVGRWRRCGQEEMGKKGA
uniref:Uncharacterized protein n=1 Tax=Arundo donax TaxID=35708 RepID=A0A0A8YTE5_ARUDO